MGKRVGLRYFLFCFIFVPLLFSNVHAEAVSPEQTLPFQPSKWNKSLDLIEMKLTAKNWTKEKINNTRSVLNDLQRNAKECIQYSQTELDKINVAFSQPVAANPNQTHEITTASLSPREIELSDLRAECRLFLMRSQEVLTQVDKLKEHVIASEIFSKNTSLIGNLQQAPTINELYQEVDTALILQRLGYPYFTKINVVILGFFIFAGLVLGYRLSIYSTQKLFRAEKTSLIYSVLASFSRYSYGLALSLVLSVFFILYSWPNVYTFLGRASNYIFIYFFLLAWFQAIFYPPLGAKAVISLPDTFPQKIFLRLFYLLTWVLFYYLCTGLFRGQNFPVSVSELGMTVYISLLSFCEISIIWLIMRLPRIQRLNKHFRITVKLAIAAALFTVLFSEWAGFHYFSIFLLKNIIVTFLLVCLAFGLRLTIRQQIERLEQNPKFRYHLGVRSHRTIPELYLLKLVLLVAMWAGLIAVLLNSWVLSEYYYNQLMHSLMDGFRVLGLTVIPSRILLATFIFVLLMLVNRHIQVFISRRSPHYIEEGTQVVTASIVGYLVFAIFLIFSLIIAGVNFTSLAIITGALSVGIGFGLQNIVNNFISGLILLLDNNIRPGDRIQVGDLEGIVKRIRLRATHIYTSRHADIFIPNSELISKSVTNFVFHDKSWGICCSVGVEYGCDIAHIKAILLKAAESHPEVIQESGKKPVVLLKKFADSTIVFELWCLISDINKKGVIESDLNSAIYEAFRENHINMPYPQQDIHIKDWPEHVLPEQEK